MQNPNSNKTFCFLMFPTIFFIALYLEKEALARVFRNISYDFHEKNTHLRFCRVYSKHPVYDS